MSYIKTPAESATAFLRYTEHLKKYPGIKWGTPNLDQYIVPAKPGDVIAFIGRPGHGKSSIMSYFAKQEALSIIKNGKAALSLDQEGQVVLYATYEQSIESQEASSQAGKNTFSISDVHWGKVGQSELIKANQDRIKLPIWIAGQSYWEPGKPPMYIDSLYENIVDIINKFNLRFNLICLDYLQLIPVRKGKERHLQVAEAILGAKELAQAVGCPVYIGAQAKEAVDHRDDKVPGLGDAYYSSEVGHVIDKGFGLMKPIKYFDEYSDIGLRWNGQVHKIPVTDNLFLLSMFKQRGEQGSRRFPLYFDMSNLILGDVAL
jgi:replicative DNA helicase